MSQEKLDAGISLAYQCDFCTKEVLDLQKIAEVGSVQILYPRHPVIEASALVIPKRHIELVEDMTEEEMADILKAVRMLKKTFGGVYGSTGFNLFANSGVVSGQHIPHVHFHFFGRSAAETINPFRILNDSESYKKRPIVTPEELQARVGAIRLAL